MKRQAFTLIEMLVAAALLAVGVGGLFSWIQQSRRESADLYATHLARQAAREPMEVFQTFGFRWVQEYSQHPLAEFPLGWKRLTAEAPGGIARPAAVTGFLRHIALNEVEQDGLRGIRVRVTVRSDSGSGWWSLPETLLEDLVLEHRE